MGLSFSGADAGVLVLKVHTVILTKSCGGLFFIKQNLKLGLLGSLGFKSRVHEFLLCNSYNGNPL